MGEFVKVINNWTVGDLMKFIACMNCVYECTVTLIYESVYKSFWTESITK